MEECNLSTFWNTPFWSLTKLHSSSHIMLLEFALGISLTLTILAEWVLGFDLYFKGKMSLLEFSVEKRRWSANSHWFVKCEEACIHVMGCCPNSKRKKKKTENGKFSKRSPGWLAGWPSCLILFAHVLCCVSLRIKLSCAVPRHINKKEEWRKRDEGDDDDDVCLSLSKGN